jgi:hypothetical protein
LTYLYWRENPLVSGHYVEKGLSVFLSILRNGTYESKNIDT